MNSFNRWVRSKSGITTIVSVIVVALVVAIIGQFAGWWGGPGTAGLPPLTEDSCMPTCSETDGRFLVLAGSNMASFGGFKNTAWISAPQGDSFTLSIFDGDSGGGGTFWYEGHWDTMAASVTYTLYADPARDGSTSTVVGTWSSTQMSDNAWYDISINNVQAAVNENGDYVYRFVANLDTPPATGASSYKLKSPNAYISVAGSAKTDASFGLVGMLGSKNDVFIIYPNFPDLANTTYGGAWEFYFALPEVAEGEEGGGNYIEIWDGDFDRGTSVQAQDLDTDDPNTIGKPEWAGSGAVDERAAGKGAPADDTTTSIFKRSPSIQYTIIAPDGTEIAIDTNVGGTEEWERFVISTDPNSDADVVVADLPAGIYKLRIEGLDMYNAVWINTKLDLFSSPPPKRCTPGEECLAGGYSIVALNPGDCQGEQNGLLFHGTSYTLLYGKAISNGCLRSVGTHLVEAAAVEYVGEYDNKNSQVKIIPDPQQVNTPVSVDVSAPNCDDPAAHYMDGKDFSGDVYLEPGLYCISGDVTMNAGDVVKGDDVTLYFIDGKVTINGGATVQLSAPYSPGVDFSPALSNILFYVPARQDKKGEADGQVVKITGNSDSYFSGTIYAPSSLVEFLGTSHTEGCENTQIIGWDVRIGGTADVTFCYVCTEEEVCELP